MPEIPDVSAIAQQIKARIKHIEDQLKQHHVLTDLSLSVCAPHWCAWKARPDRV